jgi:hypothetical protein
VQDGAYEGLEQSAGSGSGSAASSNNNIAGEDDSTPPVIHLLAGQGGKQPNRCLTYRILLQPLIECR